jgi:inner membrane protein
LLPKPSPCAGPTPSWRWAGLKQASKLTIAGRGETGFEPSIGVAASGMSGIHARLIDLKPAAATPAAPNTAPSAFDFDFTLAFTGSARIDFSPVARETSIALASDWPSPSFMGSFLPVSREVGKAGFTAAWKVPHLARSVPQAWGTDGQDVNLGRLDPYRFGANLYVPVDFYDLVTRAVKYGIMFPMVAFMAVFIMEVLNRKRLHPVQYAFTGVALIMFFVLVLSLAEHIGFAGAYVLSALATSLLIAAYVWRAIGSAAKGGIMLAVLLILYGLLYLILQLEDYALLAGALAGFVMLSAAMFLTLGIDWSGSGSTKAGEAEPATN